jgi:MFS family permease
MDAPISRRRLLRGRMVLPIVIAAGISLVLTGIVAALAGVAWLQVAVWAVGAGVGSAAMMALAAAQQSLERTRLTNALRGIFMAVALAVLALVVGIAANWITVGALPLDTVIIVAAGLVVVFAGVFVWMLLLASCRLDEIRRSRLLSGGSLVSGMQGAMFALDFGLIRDILVERRAVEKGFVRPSKGRGLGLLALVWRDVERLRRDPRPFIALLLSLFVPYAADALGMGQLNPLLSAIALMTVIIPFLGSMRVLSRTGGLARSFPFPTAQLRTALMIVPAFLALAWAAAATPAFIGISQLGVERTVPDAYLASLAVAAAGLFGGVRWVTAKKVDFNAPMMATESGAMPPSLIFNVIRGFEVIAVITAPVILNWGGIWSLGIAAVVFMLVRGTFNMDDMKAQSEQAQKDLAASRGQGPAGAKKKIPRPTR